MFQKIYTAIGGRKAVFLLILIIVSIVSTTFIKVEYYTSMMQYLAIMFGAFCAGNGLEYIGNRGTNNNNNGIDPGIQE